MKLSKLISGLSIIAVLFGCSNQNPTAINAKNESEIVAATQVTVYPGLANLMTVGTSKYVSNDNTNIIKANNAKVGSLQQFYINDNHDGTFSFKAMNNAKYVTVQDDAKLAVLNSSIQTTNKFKLYSASSTDPEQLWIIYNNVYQGWYNYGESYIKINLNQTIYKVAIDKIYGSSGTYNSTDRSYSWSNIYLMDNSCSGVSGGGVNYKFYAKGTIPYTTTLTLYIDNINQGTYSFVNGKEIKICSKLSGYNQHNFKVKFNNSTQLDYFRWGIPVGVLAK
jgi:hypothetical protein